MQLLDIVLVCQYLIVFSVERFLEACQSQSYVNMYYYTTCKLHVDRTLFTFMVSFTFKWTTLCVFFLVGLGLAPQVLNVCVRFSCAVQCFLQDFLPHV